MTLKPLALVLEIAALALLVGAFTADPLRWDLAIGGLALFVSGFAIRRRYGDQ